jgi:uncharacterized membrane protein
MEKARLKAFTFLFDKFLLCALALLVMLAFILPIGQIDNIRYPILLIFVLVGFFSFFTKSLWRQEEIKRILGSKYFPLALTFIFATIFFRIKLLQWDAGQISGVDFSHLDYAIWSTTKGRFMQIPIVPDAAAFNDFFGNHYSPILFVHVFFRWLVDSPKTTLFVHAISLAAAIPILYSLARTYLDKIPAALFLFVFVFCGSLASTLQFDIHQESFFPLAWGLFFLGYRTQVWKLFLGAILVLSIKEDAGIYLFWASLVLAVTAKEKRILLIPVGVASLLYTFLALRVLMPMHQPASTLVPYYFTMWAKYGSSFQEVIVNMLKHPHWVISDVVFNKALYKNLLPWAFLPLMHPFGLMALAPVVVSSTALGVQKGFGLYYGVVLLPIFFFVSCAALKNSKFIWRWLALALCCSFFVGGSYFRFPKPQEFLPEITLTAEKISAEKSKEIWVQSGLLPFLDYGTNWRRLDAMEQLAMHSSAEVVLFEGLEQSSLSGDAQQIDSALEEKGFHLVERSGRFRRYKK